MKFKTIKSLLFAAYIFRVTSTAQQHSEQNHSKYVAPTDPLVQQKLSKWQDVKFGLTDALGHI